PQWQQVASFAPPPFPEAKFTVDIKLVHIITHWVAGDHKGTPLLYTYIVGAYPCGRPPALALHKKFRYRAVLVDSVDNIAKQFCNRKNGQVCQAFAIRSRDGIGNHDLFDRCIFETLDGGA